MKKCNKPHITVTDIAKAHFSKLLTEEEVGTNLRLVVHHPGTPKAEVGMTYCPEAQEEHNDYEIDCGQFKLFINEAALDALTDAVIDFKSDQFGGQLSVKAPYIKGRPPEENAPFIERIQYLIQSEINPQLASHGGMVKLIQITDEMDVHLQFGGGCHGCSMSTVTLKSGIEKTLREHYPEIREVVDVTNHEEGTNPYFTS